MGKVKYNMAVSIIGMAAPVADQFSNYPDLWSYWCGANQLYCLWNYGSMFTGSVCETVLLKGIEV